MYEPRPDQPAFSRRDALKAAIAMVGGTVVGSSLPTLAFATGEAPRFFSQLEFATLQHTVDALIPDTDTPGAVAADVHHVIDALMSDWATDEVREKMADALARIDTNAQAMHGSRLAGLDASQRLEVIRHCDASAHDGVAEDETFLDIKRITLMAYYTSEIGASVELRFDPVPGPFQGKVSLEEVGRTLYKHGR